MAFYRESNLWIQAPVESTTSETRYMINTCEACKGCEHSYPHQGINTFHPLYRDPVPEEIHTDHLSINKSYISIYKSGHHQNEKVQFMLTTTCSLLRQIQTLTFTMVSLIKSYSNLLSWSWSTGGKSMKRTPFLASWNNRHKVPPK